MIDSHTHLWLKAFESPSDGELRGADWAIKVVVENTPQSLKADYALLFPDQQVTPLVFGWPERYVDIEKNNRWVAEQSLIQRFPTLFVCKPEMPAAELEQAVKTGGFCGLKPYLEFAPAGLSSDEICIYDFLPRQQLEVASANGWVVVLHLPRPGRLGDELNLRQLVEMERDFPGARVVVAHLGRAYCPADLGEAIERLGGTERLSFDFSANTNLDVMTQILKAFGSQRVIFGSDLPVTRMRMRRVCKDGTYINLVPRGAYAGVAGDRHIREVGLPESDGLTYFLYEQTAVLLAAAENLGMDRADIERIFFNNAYEMLVEAGYEWN
jgi:predicted TIM-barrel fold metal-dependent hydrolase